MTSPHDALAEAAREAETLLTNYLVAGKFPPGSDCEEVRDMLRAALRAGSGDVITDSAGVAVEYRPLSSLRPGDEIAGGWKPWAKVERVEIIGEQGRVYYTTHGPTEWFPLAEQFPVVRAGSGKGAPVLAAVLWLIECERDLALTNGREEAVRACENIVRRIEGHFSERAGSGDSEPGTDLLLRDINKALYRAFFVDDAAAARWASIKDGLDEDTRGALSFGLVGMEPPPQEVVDYFRALHAQDTLAAPVSPHDETLREALAELVRLKDGPRDSSYLEQKENAWDVARTALTAPAVPAYSETLRAVALTLAFVRYDDSVIADEVPQAVWTALHDEGLVKTVADFTGEGVTLTTPAGRDALSSTLAAARPDATKQGDE